MEPVEYLRALRRYWTVVAAAVLVALIAAFLTRTVDSAGGPSRTYEATTVLVSSTQSAFRATGSLADPNTAAFITTLDPIPQRVAKDVGFAGNPRDLASRIDATVDQTVGLVSISATGPDPTQVTQLADTFAAELLQRLGELNAQSNAPKISNLVAQIKSDKKQIAAAGAGVNTSNLNTQLTQDQSALHDLRASADDPGFQVVTPATPRLAVSAGFTAPKSFKVRALIAVVIGLIAGSILALILGRFDTRIRTKHMAEQAFSLPVLAEIPVIRTGRGEVVAVTQPASRSAEAFRILGAEVSRGEPPNGDAGASGAGTASSRAPQTLLVTSPGPSDGKTTVVANLAAILSEMGKTVLVVSCDFHRPSLHSFFGVENDHGLTEALASSNGKPVLDGVVVNTSIQAIRLVPSGPRPKSAGELLSSNAMRDALEEARKMADVVLLDTPPILVASDATHLLPDVDAVLLVARAGRTKEELAERTTELLTRLGAPVKGVVLNRASEVAVPRGYRLYYRKGDGYGKGDGGDVGEFPTSRVTENSDTI